MPRCLILKPSCEHFTDSVAFNLHVHDPAAEAKEQDKMPKKIEFVTESRSTSCSLEIQATYYDNKIRETLHVTSTQHWREGCIKPPISISGESWIHHNRDEIVMEDKITDKKFPR